MGQSTSRATPDKAAVAEIPSHGSIRGALLVDRESGKPKTQRFTGIPYAQPPTGPLRWRRPQRLGGNFRYDEGGCHYRDFGNVCPQPLTYYSQAGCVIPPHPLTHTYSEDCLQLNIWTPVDSEGRRRKPSHGRRGLPVLFFIHGGWLQIGNAHLSPSRDPSDLIASAGLDCIVVTPGYRLNVFGFLAHDALRHEDADGLTGNYGFWDQRLALEWVYENIAYFGGDPDCITVGGLSAGAHSAHSQLLHEFDRCQRDAAYRPIIKRLFLQSNAVAWPPKRVDELADQFQELCQAFGVPQRLSSEDKVEQLRQVADTELAAAASKLQMHTFRAVHDDRPNAFVRTSWTMAMADGSFGRWCEQHRIAILVGEVDKEEKIYEIVNGPHDEESFVRQLTNYYPEHLVRAIVPLYGVELDQAAAKGASNTPAGQSASSQSSPPPPAEDGVENLYSIFNVDRSATKAEIRTAYLGLVRMHHPDKAQQSDGSLLTPDESSSALIRQLNTAYAILSDDLTRQAYDRALEAQISQAEASKGRGSQIRVSDTLDLDSFQALRIGGDDASDSGSDDEGEIMFVHPCRCGHDYRIAESQIAQGVELVACGGCSEVVRVTWSDHDGVGVPQGATGTSTAPAAATPEAWRRLYGEILADSQVYLTSRVLIQDLLRGGLSAHAILRYKCEFRAPIYDTFAPASMGVSHAFDDPVWWYTLSTGEWNETQLKRIRKWLAPFCHFVQGPASGPGCSERDVDKWREKIATEWYGPEYDVEEVKHAEWIRILKPDATFQIAKVDERGQNKRELIEKMQDIRKWLVQS